MVDERLLSHWLAQHEARREARAALPRSWREDDRPEMAAVRETYIEAMLEFKGTALRLVRDDD